MRNLLLSLAALGPLAAGLASTPAAAQLVWSDAGLQHAQYYEPGWREREEWRRRREFEARRHEEWRRAHEYREYNGYRPPPPPPPYYAPRY